MRSVAVKQSEKLEHPASSRTALGSTNRSTFNCSCREALPDLTTSETSEHPRRQTQWHDQHHRPTNCHPGDHTLTIRRTMNFNGSPSPSISRCVFGRPRWKLRNSRSTHPISDFLQRPRFHQRHAMNFAFYSYNGLPTVEPRGRPGKAILLHAARRCVYSRQRSANAEPIAIANVQRAELTVSFGKRCAADSPTQLPGVSQRQRKARRVGVGVARTRCEGRRHGAEP